MAAVREPYAAVSDWVETMPAEIRPDEAGQAEDLFRRIGITSHCVYGEGGRPGPADPV